MQHGKTCGNMSNRKATAKRKAKAKYPYIGVRFPAAIDRRLRMLASRTGLKISHLLQGMVQKHLAELEAFHAAKG